MSIQLTPQQAVERMREAGIGIGIDTLRCGLAQGVFPFGCCIQRDTERRLKTDVYIIWAVLLEKWIRERTVVAVEM